MRLQGPTSKHTIPGLGTVVIDYVQNEVVIRLDPAYEGDLRSWERINELPLGVYFAGGPKHVIRDAAFQRFLEVATHWDHDGDGVYDCDAMLRELDQVCEQWGVDVEELKRPTSSFMTWALMRFMPPQPERHIWYTFGRLRPHYRPWHFLITTPGLAIFIGLVLLQNHFLPLMRYSPLTGWLWFSERFGFIYAIVLLVAVITLKKMIIRPQSGSSTKRIKYRFGLLNKAAPDEEQIFREGAEDWNWHERLRSNLIFGLVHQSNLFYPLASILPLAMGGWIFMRVYLHFMERTKFRRSAVYNSGVTHRVWNFEAFCIIGFAILATTGGLIASSLMSVVAFFTCYGVISLALDKIFDHLSADERIRELV